MSDIDLIHDPFDDLRKPPYSENTIIRRALEMRKYMHTDRETTLIIMVKALAEVNAEYYDILKNIHKPTVYQVNYNDPSPDMKAKCDKVRNE